MNKALVPIALLVLGCASASSPVPVRVDPHNSGASEFQLLVSDAIGRLAPRARDVAVAIEFDRYQFEFIHNHTAGVAERPIISPFGHYEITDKTGRVIEAGDLPYESSPSEQEALINTAAWIARRVAKVSGS